MLHFPANPVFVALGFIICMALGYLVGEIILRFARRCALRRSTNEEQNRRDAADLEAGEAVLERIRWARQEKIKEGERKVNSLPLVSFESEDNTSRSRECAICLEDFEVGDSCRVVSGCNHGFHVQCVDDWLKKKQRCPVCRREI